MISPLITVVINLYLVIISLLSAYFKSELFKLNICFSFLRRLWAKIQLKKGIFTTKNGSKDDFYSRKHFLCQSVDSLLLLQITHPIRCTTTSHVTTQTILATARAHVWWPRISVRSSACVSMSVSLTFLSHLERKPQGLRQLKGCFSLALRVRWTPRGFNAKKTVKLERKAELKSLRRRCLLARICRFVHNEALAAKAMREKCAVHGGHMVKESCPQESNKNT